MRKINRDDLPPVEVYKNGKYKGISKWRVAENEVILAFKNDSTQFDNGKYVFKAHPSYDKWKIELINVQGEKCCFCEKAIENGVIEHFRPKKGWQQNVGDPINRPGYYWLAYRWKNLLLSCTECNESGQKGNLFPISGKRSITPRCNLGLELNDLINPYEEDPNDSISFYKSTPISTKPRGHSTITILKLQNRGDINQIREDKWSLYNLANKISKILSPIAGFTQQDINEAKICVKTATQKKEPFSGMINENIRNGTFF